MSLERGNIRRNRANFAAPGTGAIRGIPGIRGIRDTGEGGDISLGAGQQHLGFCLTTAGEHPSVDDIGPHARARLDETGPGDQWTLPSERRRGKGSTFPPDRGDSIACGMLSSLRPLEAEKAL